MRHSKMLHKSGDSYLEAVLILQKKQDVARFVDVSRHIEV